MYNYLFVLLLILFNLNKIDLLRIEHLKELSKDTNSITIEWQVNLNDLSSSQDWIGFKIKYFTDKLQYTPILLKNINVRKFRLDNLKTNTEYKIQISAFNINENEGPASSLLSIKTNEAVPGEPQDFKVVKISSNSIELEWKAPRKEEQSTSSNIKGYEIHYFKVSPSSSSSSSATSAQLDTKETQIFKRKTNDIKKLKYTLTDLEPNSLYKIQIFAYNMKGDGQRSNPLLVNTLDEGPAKPDNIKSEIHNDLLIIKWQLPVNTQLSNNKITGFRIYFNSERYDIDSAKNQITFQKNKWEYDHQYEFRISAKSTNSKNLNMYGQEAIYRISTQTNQTKLTIQLEKLTSKSVLIKWNKISLSKNSNQATYYKLEYYLKTNPETVIKHENLKTNELQLTNLKPNSDYIIQLVALSLGLTSEVAIEHFRTLVADIDPPTNVQLNRFEANKINIKWDPVEMLNPDYLSEKKLYNLIKGYRIYYKELSGTSSSEYEYDSDLSEEWKTIEITGDKNTEYEFVVNNTNRDYAFKITAIDYLNNEGPESQTMTYKFSTDSDTEFDQDQQIEQSPSMVDYSSISNNQISEKIGQPRDLEIIEYTSTSIKFSWMPPEPSQSYQIKNFVISYVDRAKQYKESNGSLITYLKGIGMTIKAPARDDPTIKITWLVTGLSPFTEYDFNISAVTANDLQGLPVQRHIKTKVDKPFKVDAPKKDHIYTDNTVLMRTGNASEFHGPILKYWLVIVPLGYESSIKLIDASKSEQQTNDILKQQAYDNREKDISNLFKYSLFNQSILSNESSYIAAEFLSEYWPSKFLLGDGNKYGKFLNRKLIPGYDYKAYIIAFTDESNRLKQHSNMINIGDVVSPNKSPKFANLESDLFTYSAYSDVFNTRHIETTSSPIHSGSFGDYQNILWVVGAIAGFIFIFILIIIISVNLMQKKNKLNSNRNGLNSATSSNTTTTNFLNKQVDTQVIMNKLGSFTTNTLKKNSHDSQINTGRTSSSSSSSTTVSPTTALLSCSVNNNSLNNVGAGSQSSSNTNTNNTNNTNIILNSNGLLTAASPIKNNIQAESLYTSIEVTQKLLQQQQQQQMLNTSAPTSSPYDSMNMMIMMSNSTFNSAGTLNRNHQMINNSLGLINHYDPIEYRRIHYPTQALLNHPPMLAEDMSQYIEKLKLQNNLKFSQEYESIEPGQQFTWEHSLLDINRQKNRYANVIAYDHSRVILSKLPVSLYQTNSNSNSNNLNSNIQQQLQSSVISDLNSSLPPPPPPPPLPESTPNELANCSDYINANYIDGYRKRNMYIATQGPLPSTFGDFWRMMWEQQTCTIVMMTKLEERNRLKCDQYWPSKGTEVYDNCMQVTLVDLTELATYTIRTFVIAPVNQYAQLQLSSNSNNINYEMRREIKHFQYTSWPDHGVPDHPTQFLMFLRRVKTLNPVDSGPIVVHCSAGVGRTGCYIVIDCMLDRMLKEKTIDIYGLVTCLRSQRNYMVQTEDQYIFCYDAVLEAVQSGQTEIKCSQLYQHLQYLLQISNSDPSLMLTEMELEYKRLSNIKAPQSKFQSANLPANKFKNRLVNILPYEATRVVLEQLPNVPEGSGTDYINANFIDGYKYKKAYIATQAPLVETCDDFWRMLWEHNSTIIVMLTKLREMGREKCAQYWPLDRSIRYQYFVVDPIAEYNMSQYILREFKVTDARDGQSRTIRQFQFIDWPEQGVPKSGESIIELIGQVHKTKEQFGQTGPITVHCSAGVGRTGVFITLSIVLERIRFEGLIDVFNTVKVLRSQRPAMVQTEDQYQFCYRAALEYLGSFDNYD